MRVILADASAASRSVWRSLVEGVGLAPKDVVEVADEASLLQAVGDGGEVSLVLMSWILGAANGFTLIGQIRQRRKGASTPILAVGDAADRSAMEASMKVGLTGYVVRPPSPIEFTRKVKRALFGDQFVDRTDDDSRNKIRAIVSTAAAEAELPFFIQLPSNAMQEFLGLSTNRKYAQGEVLLAAGLPVEALHVLTLGQAELREAGVPPRVLDMGECFGEVAFLTEKPNAATVVASGPVEVNSLDRPGLAELVRRHPGVGQFLSGLVSRRTKMRAGRPPSAPSSGVGGSLASMPFPDLIQMLHSTRKSGVLSIEDGERKSGILFEEGEVRHAWAENVSGEAAFNRIAGWKKGLFYFRAGSRVTHPTTIRTGTLGLLMEAMRLVDESSQKGA